MKADVRAESAGFDQRTLEYAEQYVHADDRDAYLSLLNAQKLLNMFYKGEHFSTLEYREKDDTGGFLWRLLTVETVEYPNSSEVQAFLMYEDIDARKRAELREKELLETDPLTGALNRVAFVERVEQLLSREAGKQHAVLLLDMDGFSLLRDSFGHAAGDQALIDVCAVLRSLTRAEDHICRLGGDEFLVFLRDIDYDAVIRKIARDLCLRTRKAFSPEVQINAFIGVSVFPRDGGNFDELYRSADAALSSARKSGAGSYAFYSAAEEQSEDGSPNSDAASLRHSPAALRRMLIVDDSAISRAMLSEMFRDEYTVETAKNGADAMVSLRHFGSSITVVLLDLFMPGIDGFEVLRRMQSNIDLRTIPVIVVSSGDDNETLIKAIECGATDFITKPVDADLIRVRIRSAVSKAENERLRAQNSYLQLQRGEELKYRSVLASTGTVVIEYNRLNEVFIYDSTISSYLYGKYDHRELWDIFLADGVAQSGDVQRMRRLMLSLADDQSADRTSADIMLKTPKGQQHWFCMSIYKQADAFGTAEKMIITFNDIHEEVLASQKLLFQTTHDELTGIYNRAGFLVKAKEMIDSHEAGYYVMSCIDLEKFKVINDQFGTDKGDQVLQGFARVLSRLHNGEHSICCRIMGDNFAVLYPKTLIGSPELNRSRKEAEQPDSSLPPIQYVVGRYIVNDKTLDVSAIYDRAVMAKDTIKGRYDRSIATYDESMRASILRQQEITGQMNQALESRQFEVWLQPQFNHVTGLLSGAEALVRWRHPTEGIISPAEFIPIFERNGFVYEVDKFVWEEACRLLHKWRSQGLEPVPLSVNISRYDVFRPDLVDIILALIAKYELQPEHLRLEITESAFSESAEQIIRVVKAFRALGFTVEIDDFGSGYSSLNTLKDVPAQVLKLDMHFLENDSNAQRGGSIVESVVRMAKWLGMSVIAEGVETIEQADYLRSIGCKYMQGYLYSRPVHSSEYERLFAAGRTELKLTELTTVSTWNNNAFWNPKSMETLIFNSYVGGACIFEYFNGKTELLRYSDSYEAIFHGRLDYDFTSSRHDVLEVLDGENKAKLLATRAEAVASGKEASCELRLPGKDNTCIFVRLTVRMIADSGERSLYYCVVNDITSQRLAESRERDAASRAAAIMEHVDGGITAVHSENGRPKMIFSNDRYYSQLGYTREQFSKEVPTYFDAIHPEDRPRVWGIVGDILKNGAPRSLEYRCTKKDGFLIYIRSNIALCRIDGIEGDVMLTVETDVTELVLEQQRSARAVSRLHFLNDTAHDILAQTDMEAAVHTALEKCLTYFDCSRAYIMEDDAEKGVVNCTYEVCSHGAPALMEQWQELKIGMSGSRSTTVLAIRDVTSSPEISDEFRRLLLANGISSTIILPLRREGVIFGAIGVDGPTAYWDELEHLNALGDYVAILLTRRDMARELMNKTAQMQQLMDDTPGGFVRMRQLPSGDFEPVYANEGFVKMLGLSHEQLRATFGKNVLDGVHPDDRAAVREAGVQMLIYGEAESAKFRVKDGSGKDRWLTLYGKMSKDEKGEVYLNVYYSDVDSRPDGK